LERTDGRASLSYLNGTIWTLHLTCPTGEALAQINDLGFSVNDFKNANRASVFARSTAVAFI